MFSHYIQRFFDELSYNFVILMSFFMVIIICILVVIGLVLLAYISLYSSKFIVDIVIDNEHDKIATMIKIDYYIDKLNNYLQQIITNGRLS